MVVIVEFPVELPPLRIHNHDLVSWKGCRRRHKFGSNMAGSMGLEPVARNSPFWLGTGVHKALEHIYSPRPPTPDGLRPTPVQTFTEYADTWKQDNAEALLQMDPREQEFLESDIMLGTGMLSLYDQYRQEVDDFDLIAAEQEFSLPLRDTRGNDLWLVGLLPDGRSYRRQVFVEGKMDGIVRDRAGLLWFLEHKTYKHLDPRKLENDHQVGVYLWAARRIYGWTLAGCIYNVLKKKTAIIPPLAYVGTKREALSRAKTTLDATLPWIYRLAISRHGFDDADYQEELAYLDAAGWSNFFERYTIRRSPQEIEEVGLRMYHEVMDMAPTLQTGPEDLRNFPNPDPLRCPWCPFRDPCLALSAGADWKGMLEDDSLYRRRASMDSLDYEEVPI